MKKRKLVASLGIVVLFTITSNISAFAYTNFNNVNAQKVSYSRSSYDDKNWLYTSHTDVNVRTDAGLDSDIRGTLVTGLSYPIIKKKAAYRDGQYWDKIKFHGSAGYVSHNLVTYTYSPS